MKIVIDIDEKIFKEVTKYDGIVPSGNRLYDSILLSIYNGTPLPKGHGRLIDADNITFSCFFDAGDYAQARRGIYEVPTIIEADKGSDSDD